MERPVPQVIGRYQPVAGQLALITQIPLLHVHVVQVEWKIDERSLEIVDRIRAGRLDGGKRIAAGISLIGVGETSRRRRLANLVAPGRRLREVLNRIRLRRIEEYPIGTANALLSASARVPCKPETWSEASPIDVCIGGGNPRHGGVILQSGRRVRVLGGLL